MQEIYNKQKEACGRWATFLWIGAGVYFFITWPSAKFISWQAAVFFIPGMFLAAVVFGILGYALQRILAKILTHTNFEPSPSYPMAISSLGWAVIVLEAIAIFFAAKYVMSALVTL